MQVIGMTATALAGRIARGEISAVAAVEAHIARIEAINGRLNAVVVKRYAAARAEAVAADTRRAAGEPLPPLHGVPVTVKECLDLAGTPSTFGIPGRAGHKADADETHVARLRRAGAIVLGKTNVAQALLYFESDNPLHGRCNNPWDAARTPGGSSGGEAAIIAAGGSALGLGTDLGGSVRIPAAFCGIAGLKPTAGRCVDTGRFSLPVGQQVIVSQVGVLARAVDDVTLGLRAIDGPGETVPPLGDPATVDLTRLRVGVCADDGTFPAAPAARRAVTEAADMLRAAGAQVVAWTPPAADQALALILAVFGADGGAGLRRITQGGRRDPRLGILLFLAGHSLGVSRAIAGLLELCGQASLARGARILGRRSVDQYWQLTEQAIDYRARFAAAMDGAEGGPLDLILSPACALPALSHGASRDLATIGAYTPLYNLLGLPAGVVPVTRVRGEEESERIPGRDLVARLAQRVERGSAGLPIGVQLAARPWREHVALAAMRAIEAAARARPDFPAAPPL